MKKIIFLISGNGGNFKFIYQCIKNNILKNHRIIIIADRECKGLEYAKIEGIENYKIYYNQKKNNELKEILKKIEADYIITNWHKIIDVEIVNLYKNRLINLHYSLLPAFGGLIGEKPLEKAIEKKCKFFGTTLHKVDELVDNGEIISQTIYLLEENKEKMILKNFKAGCYQLLSHFSQNKKIIQEKDGIIFNPPLDNILDSIDNIFWNNILENRRN